MIMLIDMVPPCPRLHPGAVISDDCGQGAREWVCRVCGTRLYGDDSSNARVAQMSEEKPINEPTGSGHTGRPRKNPVTRNDSYDLGGRNGSGGKWYE